MSLLSAKYFREVDRLIDNYLVWNFNTVQQLVSTDAENDVFYHIQLAQWPVKERLKLFIYAGLISADLSDKGGK